MIHIKRNLIFAVVIFLLAINFHFILFLGIKSKSNLKRSFGLNRSQFFEIESIEKPLEYECSSEHDTWYKTFLDTIWFWLDMFIYFVVPFITMSITYSLIAFELRKINRNYGKFLDNSICNQHNKKNFSKKIQRNNKIIYILLGINSYFCLSILPFFLFTIFKNNKWFLSIRRNDFLQTFIEILFYSNNAFNIFFYGFSSKTYMNSLREIFCMKKNINPNMRSIKI